ADLRTRESTHARTDLVTVTRRSCQQPSTRGPPMHLSRLRVQGLRATAHGEMEINLPGRFSVVIGANGAGKTTVSEALYLSHRRTFPQLPRPSAAALG